MSRHFPSSRFTKPSFSSSGTHGLSTLLAETTTPSPRVGCIIRFMPVSRAFGPGPKAGLSLCVEAAGFVSDPGGPTRPAPIEGLAGPSLSAFRSTSKGQLPCPSQGDSPHPGVGRPRRKTPGQRPDLNKCTPFRGMTGLARLSSKESWSTPGSRGASATVRGAGASRGSSTRSGGSSRG
jgi:hypothetical protein